MTIINDKLIHENKWVSLREAELETGARYMYASEPWCDSTGVAVLIYREEEWGRSYLGRYEICPSHSGYPELCSFTGGIDKEDKDAFDIAIQEVKEEAGYTVAESDLIYLGRTFPSKASNKIVHLFAVDVTEMEQGEAVGDGTLGEFGSYTQWVNVNQATFCKDPLMATMIMRLLLLK